MCAVDRCSVFGAVVVVPAPAPQPDGQTALRSVGAREEVPECDAAAALSIS